MKRRGRGDVGVIGVDGVEEDDEVTLFLFPVKATILSSLLLSLVSIASGTTSSSTCALSTLFCPHATLSTFVLLPLLPLDTSCPNRSFEIRFLTPKNPLDPLDLLFDICLEDEKGDFTSGRRRNIVGVNVLTKDNRCFCLICFSIEFSISWD